MFGNNDAVNILILGHAKNQGEKFAKYRQTSFSSIINLKAPSGNCADNIRDLRPPHRRLHREIIQCKKLEDFCLEILIKPILFS